MMCIDLHAMRAAAVAIAALASAAAAAAQTASTPSIRFDGRLHLHHDAFDGVYSNDGAHRSATYPRRARVGASGRLPWQLKYAVDVDLERGGVVVLRTAALAWSGLPAGTLRAGRFDPGFGLEQATSSNWITAIERSAMWDLAPDVADIGKGHGVQFEHAAARWYGSAGAFRKPASRGMTARAAFAPLLRERRAVHLGASLADERLDGDDGRIRTRLGVRGVTENDDGRRITLARALEGNARFDRQRVVGLEAAAVVGAFSLQAEALQRRLAGSQPSRIARGHYVQAAYTLTGEARPYDIDGAKFGRIEPANKRLGAWELFYRHDRLGVRDGDAARVHTLGLNWYANAWLRVSANLLRARSDGDFNDAGDASGNAASLRLQLVH